MPASSKPTISDFLLRLPLFNELESTELARIAEHTTELHVPRGETIFRQGDPSIGFYCVIYGRVKLSFSSDHGDEKVVEIVGPGSSFGEALMFLEKPYIVSAQALADTMLLHVLKPAVLDELERSMSARRSSLHGSTSPRNTSLASFTT